MLDVQSSDADLSPPVDFIETSNRQICRLSSEANALYPKLEATPLKAKLD